MSRDSGILLDTEHKQILEKIRQASLNEDFDFENDGKIFTASMIELEQNKKGTLQLNHPLMKQIEIFKPLSEKESQDVIDDGQECSLCMI